MVPVPVLGPDLVDLRKLDIIRRQAARNGGVSQESK
jgi:hypothetical protein